MKKLTTIMLVLLFLCGCTKVNAEGKKVDYVVDELNLLKEDEVLNLNKTLTEMNDENFAIIIHSISLSEDEEFSKISDKLLDECKAGNGLSLLVDTEKCSLYIGTKGIETISVFNDETLNLLIEDLIPLFASKEYAKGCEMFIEKVNTIMAENVQEEVLDTAE